jgi:hypothetical protein
VRQMDRGDVIISCLQCYTDVQCFTFPADWIKSCVSRTSPDGTVLAHERVFCSRNCQIKYLFLNRAKILKTSTIAQP